MKVLLNISGTSFVLEESQALKIAGTLSEALQARLVYDPECGELYECLRSKASVTLNYSAQDKATVYTEEPPYKSEIAE